MTFFRAQKAIFIAIQRYYLQMKIESYLLKFNILENVLENIVAVLWQCCGNVVFFESIYFVNLNYDLPWVDSFVILTIHHNYFLPG